MKTRLLRAGLTISSLVLAAAVMAQSSGQFGQRAQPPVKNLTREELTAAAKLYFRDTTELPLVQQMEFFVFDSSGRIRKTDKLTLEYLFQGYNPGSKTAHFNVRGHESFWSAMRGSKTFKASINSGMWTLWAGVVARDFSAYSFEAGAASAVDGPVLAKLVPKESCPAFTMTKNPEFYVADGRVCGQAEFQLDRNLRFERFSYEAPGLPARAKVAPLGECMLQRYRTEIEFQTVTIPGDREPYLVPKRVTTTLETNKGRVVISSAYEPKPSSH
jgi:hypothetical protein